MSPTPSQAAALVERLRLAPHPEGGWYRELWRAPAAAGERAAATSIHFLREAHQASHWHRVDATEIQLWHAGDPPLLSLADGEYADNAVRVRTVRLGPDVLGDEAVQHIIARGNGRRPQRCPVRTAIRW